ncbi:MAG TPA: ferric reductase-like transmembrane domain-containing protein, partial [Blastocatellia bacterium]|nr:ferric reductase-like transmembrane domain-containing protein [Blastocatellia bacterium]
MSHKYASVSWNRQKIRYDTVLALGVISYLALFIALGALLNPNATAETLIIRAFGTCAILLLHIVLVIGPLCRLSTKFLPLLYNRRHLGVTTFFLGLIHGTFSLIQFHALGDVNPLISLFISNTRINSLSEFPFQQLGFAALIILSLMAATSHDFWLKNLTPRVWKTLHMFVYVAYGLLIAHVLLGVLQAETNPLLAVMLGLGLTAVLSLHLIAAYREHRQDANQLSSLHDEFVDVCAVNEIPESRARIVLLGAERIAVFRYNDSVS